MLVPRRFCEGALVGIPVGVLQNRWGEVVIEQVEEATPVVVVSHPAAIVAVPHQVCESLKRDLRNHGQR